MFQPLHQVMNRHGWAHGGVGLRAQLHLVVVIFHDRFVGCLESLFQFEEGDVESRFVRFEEFGVERRPVENTGLIMLKPLGGGTDEVGLDSDVAIGGLNGCTIEDRIDITKPFGNVFIGRSAEFG